MSEKSWYEPSLEALTKLSTPWICSYSGGKDSTSLVTWCEWLRRGGWITAPEPRLVMSDTGIEYPFLQEVSSQLIEVLEKSGWLCEKVVPAQKDKLFVIIFGRGVPPVSPAQRGRMRWCTRATKTDPIERFRKGLDTGLLTLTGLRWGESRTRDEKLLNSGCQAGGECGVLAPGNNKYPPIINWKDTEVVSWLRGFVDKNIRKLMTDIFPTTRKLLDAYRVKEVVQHGFWTGPPKVTMLRFGCIGCPAVSTDKVMEVLVREDATMRPLRKLYWIWKQCRSYRNRLQKERKGQVVTGPIKMKVRQELFPEVLKIQEKTGVILVTPEDIAFIEQCWKDKVYPRGWSEADEHSS